MITPTQTEDSPELHELFRSIRHVARFDARAVLKLTAAVDVLRAGLPVAQLSAERIEIARQMGRDVGEIAHLEAAQTAGDEADKQLIARMPAPRVTMLKTFAGASIATMAARARVLGWDHDHPDYPAPQR